MTAVTSTNSSPLISKSFLSNWTKKAGKCEWALPWVGIAISIIGMVTSIFSGVYGGAVGFALFGLSIIHYKYFSVDKEAQKLETEIEKTDQELVAKQKLIESTTAQLQALQKSADQARQAFGKTLSQLQKENGSLQTSLSNLQKEHTAFAQENKTLQATLSTLRQEIDASEASSSAFEEQIKAFVAEHKQFIPQQELLSGIVHGLEGADQKLQGELSGIDDTFQRDLESFSRYLRTSKGMVDKITEQNKSLQAELHGLRASQSQGQLTVQRLEAANQNLHATILEKQSDLAKMEDLKNALNKQEANLRAQTELFAQKVAAFLEEKQKFAAAKKRIPSIPE